MVLETIGYIFCILFSAFIAFLLLAPLIRMIMGALSSTKTVTAVVEKNTWHKFSQNMLAMA